MKRVMIFRFGWSPKQPWHSITVLVMGLIAGIASYGFYDFAENELRSAVQVVGLVRDSIVSENGMHRPVIEFENENGENIVFRSSYSSKPQSYFKGDEVEILYFPGIEKKPKIKSIFTIWGAAIFSGVFSIFSFIMSVVIWVLRGSGKST